MRELNLLAAAPWSGWTPATCLPTDCFCEAMVEGFVRQPANAWSSLAFVVAAVFVARRNSRVLPGGRPVLGSAEVWTFVAALLALGFGSAFYHASLTFVGQVADVSGMYLMATFMLFRRLGPRFSIPPLPGALGFVVINGLLMVAQVTTPSVRRMAFGLLLAGAVGLEWASSRKGRGWLAAGAALMLAALVLWALDRWRVVCDPESLLQGHALWHLLGAAAAASLFRSYEADG